MTKAFIVLTDPRFDTPPFYSDVSIRLVYRDTGQQKKRRWSLRSTCVLDRTRDRLKLLEIALRFAVLETSGAFPIHALGISDLQIEVLKQCCGPDEQDVLDAVHRIKQHDKDYEKVADRYGPPTTATLKRGVEKNWAG